MRQKTSNTEKFLLLLKYINIEDNELNNKIKKIILDINEFEKFKYEILLSNLNENFYFILDNNILKKIKDRDFLINEIEKLNFNNIKLDMKNISILQSKIKKEFEININNEEIKSIFDILNFKILKKNNSSIYYELYKKFKNELNNYIFITEKSQEIKNDISSFNLLKIENVDMIKVTNLLKEFKRLSLNEEILTKNKYNSKMKEYKIISDKIKKFVDENNISTEVIKQYSYKLNILIEKALKSLQEKDLKKAIEYYEFLKKEITSIKEKEKIKEKEIKLKKEKEIKNNILNKLKKIEETHLKSMQKSLKDNYKIINKFNILKKNFFLSYPFSILILAYSDIYLFISFSFIYILFYFFLKNFYLKKIKNEIITNFLTIFEKSIKEISLLNKEKSKELFEKKVNSEIKMFQEIIKILGIKNKRLFDLIEENNKFIRINGKINKVDFKILERKLILLIHNKFIFLKKDTNLYLSKINEIYFFILSNIKYNIESEKYIKLIMKVINEN